MINKKYVTVGHKNTDYIDFFNVGDSCGHWSLKCNMDHVFSGVSQLEKKGKDRAWTPSDFHYLEFVLWPWRTHTMGSL